MSEELKLGLQRVENIVEKGENAGYQHFLLFTQYFRKTSENFSASKLKTISRPVFLKDLYYLKTSKN